MAIEVARRATGDLSRTGLELKLLAEAWARKPDGDRFVRSLATFLGSKSNKGTQRVYGFAITEFFAWYKTLKGFYPTPGEVRREDAALFVKWLQERSLGVDEQRLSQDPDRLLDLVAYRFIKKNPETRISDIRRELLNDSRLSTIVEFTVRGLRQTARVLQIEADEPRGDELEAFRERYGQDPESALDLRLACLCMHNLLRRSPSVQEIRERVVDLGLEKPEQAQIGYRVDPEVFRYWANEYTDSRGGDRAGTIVTKLSALSSFWSYLVKSTGENIPGSEALLRFNIWRELLAVIRPTALNRAQAHREESVPDRELFVRLLSSTFVRSHQSDALRAAEAFIEGVDVRSSERAQPDKYDLRDRAVLTFMFWTGVRAEELGSIRRDDLNTRTGIVTVTGKGDKRRSFRVPDAALLAVYQMQQAIDSAPKATELLDLLRQPTAPLFPPLKLWGRAQKDVESPEDLTGLTPSAIARLLHDRAEEVGIERESDEWYRLHPHGIRHLAALEAKRRGVDVATIQATLGHASLAHTGIYLEVRDPSERSLQPGAAPPRPTPAPVFEARAETRPAPSVKPTTTRKPKTVKPREEIEEPLTIERVEPEETLTIIDRPEALVEELLEPLPVGIEPEDEAIDLLLDTYRERWGEEGKRTNLLRGKPESGLVEENQFAAGALAHAYVGNDTSLPWWAGTTGEMSGEFTYTPNPAFSAMPILSPAQFVPTEEGKNELAERLSRLASEWADPDSENYRGMTAIGALLEWLNVADAISETATAVVVELRKGEWISFIDRLVETTKPPAVLREHDLGAVEAWFRATAWQWRPRQGRFGQGTEFNPPTWYDESDPLRSLNDDDRRELLDWTQVLIGNAPLDKTKMFGEQSRFGVGRFIGALCYYERILQQEGEFAEGRLKLSKEAKRALGQAELLIQGILLEETRKSSDEIKQDAAKFSYPEAKKARKDKGLLDEEDEAETSEEDDRSSEKSTEPTRTLANFYLSLVERFFGSVAAKDPILKTYALCTQGAPLAGVRDFGELFRVDPKANTIVHDEAFKRRFAREYNAHSECVARRLARHLWEDGDIRKKAKRKRWASDATLNALLEYRTPCPADQEEELRRLNPDLESVAVASQFEAMRDADRMPQRTIVHRVLGMDEAWQEKLVGGEEAAEGGKPKRRYVANHVPFWFAARTIRNAYQK